MLWFSFLLLMLPAISGGVGVDDTATALRPNVLFVYIEDMSVDLNVDLGAYSVSPVQTPQLDRLAAEGTRFTNAYCPFPICNPSRISTMTGLRATTTGISSNRQPLLERELLGVPILPYKFLLEGYQVIGTGKIFHSAYVHLDAWHEYLVTNDDPWIDRPQNPVPEDDFRPVYFGPYLNGADASLGKLRETKSTDFLIDAIAHTQEPFFLALGYEAPHNPFVYPEKLESLYHPSLDVPALPAIDATDQWKAGLAESAYISSNYLDPAWDHDPEMGRHEATAAYWRTQTFVDEEFGRVLDALESRGLRERTIVVVVSDHGWSNGHHQRYGKNRVFDWSSRTLLTISVPWMNATHGVPCSRPVDHVDLYPTLMELCRMAPPSNLDGASLVPLLLDAEAEFKPAFYAGNGLATKVVRTDQFKFAFYDNGKHQLYDLNSDPGEYHNLFGDSRYDAVVFEHMTLLRESGMLGDQAFSMPYGPGRPGALGTPLIAATDPHLGSTMTLSLESSSPHHSLGLLGWGVDPNLMGHGIVVDMILTERFPLPAAGVVRHYPMPVRDLWWNVSLYLQLLQQDPAAEGGIAMSPGLWLSLGR